MATRQTYTISGQTYPSKKAVLDRAAEIKAAHEGQWGVPLEGEEAAFMTDLLHRHPEAKTKIGPGLAYITLLPNEGSVKGQGYGFVAVRTDGTHVRFGPDHCLNGTDLEKAVQGAFRAEIAGQMAAYKKEAFRTQAGPDGKVECPYGGGRVGWDDAEVDHAPPGGTFVMLFWGFLAFKKLTLEKVPLERRQAGTHRLADPALAAEWRRFHELRWTPQIASRVGNRDAGNLAKLTEPEVISDQERSPWFRHYTDDGQPVWGPEPRPLDPR
jgi:hypothetical protein